MESFFAEVNGAACRYLMTGSGDATLVLVHELGGSLNSWDALVPLLPPTLRVLRYDMRGAGMSEKLRGRVALDTLADDLDGLLDIAGASRPIILMGAAIGAAIAIRFAVCHPDSVARLVLVSPALGVPAERKDAATKLTERLDREGIRAIAPDVLPKAFPETLWECAEHKRVALARWLGADPEGYAAAYRILIDTNLREELPSVRCPTLILTGRHDPFSSPGALEHAAASMKDGRMEAIEAGHFAAIQSPKVVAEALLHFLAEG